jgi:flavin reductase (DIM6/NTAB) family NADH-FMN oxidoreductase RutF
MLLDFSELSPNRVYHTVTQTLIPRPIAWVLTEGEQGQLNLAPFSYFTAVCSNPALLLVSIGKKADGSDKDTLANIKRSQRCVIHIASTTQLDELNGSSEELAAEISEVEKLGIKTEPFVEAEGGLPRLTDCTVAYDCSLYEVKEIGGLPQSLLLLEVHKAYIADSACVTDAKGRLSIDACAINPLARLGVSEYASLGEVVEKKRPL